MARTQPRQGPPAPVPPAPPRNDSDEDNAEEVDDNADLFPEDEDAAVPAAQPPVADPSVQPAVQPAAHGPAVGPTDKDLAMEYYKQVLKFNDNAARLLSQDQQLTHPSDFLELEDDDIDNICQAIRKPGGAGAGS